MLDHVTRTYRSIRLDEAIQPRAVNKWRKHLLPGQVIEVLARHIQPRPFQNHFTDAKASPDQMIERDALCRKITPRFLWIEPDSVVALQRIQNLAFNQRYLSVRMRLERVSTEAGRITVAFNSVAGNKLASSSLCMGADALSAIYVQQAAPPVRFAHQNSFIAHSLAPFGQNARSD